MNHTMLSPEIIEVTSPEAKWMEAVNMLLPELSERAKPLTQSQWEDLIGNPASRLFLLRCGSEICGMLTLGRYPAPTGWKCWIEDVVISALHRGKGYGRLLVEHAIRIGTQNDTTLMLTSKPARKAANALYRSAGFSLKETNVYVKRENE